MHSTLDNDAIAMPQLWRLRGESSRPLGRRPLPTLVVLAMVVAGGAMAQPSLTLSSAAGAPGGATALNLTLTSPSSTPVSGLQWTMSYPAASVSAINVTAGPSAATAAKTISCAGGAAAYTCVLTGMNANAIGNGAIASVAITLSSSASSAAITLGGGLASSPAGDLLSVSTTGGGVQAPIGTPVTVTGISCSSASLGASGSTSCSVALSGAVGTGGATVALTSSSAALAVPASITVPQGAANASFNVSTGAITATSTAKLTASLNGSSASTSISLTASTNTGIKVTAVRCNTTSLSSSSYTYCLVFLSGAAGTGGTTVALASSSAALTTPTSLTVPQGAASASFMIKTGTIAATSSATLTASLNGSSASISISLIGPTNSAQLAVSAVRCTSNSLPASSGAPCSVSLSGAAGTGGATVALASNSTALAVPASITVPQGAANASFNVSTGAITAPSTAKLTASLNGSSASTSISLIAPTNSTQLKVTALRCNTTSLSSSSYTYCLVFLSGAAGTGGTTVALASSSAALTAPASLTVPQGAASASFMIKTGTIAATSSATLTASLGGSSFSTVLTLLTAPVVRVWSLSCPVTSISSGASATCVVSLSGTAPAGGATLAIAVSPTGTGVTAPASVTISAGSKSAFVGIASGAITTSQTVTITASLNGSSAQTTLSALTPTKLTSTALVRTTEASAPQEFQNSAFSCDAKAIQGGDRTTCQLRLDSPGAAADSVVSLSSSSGNLKTPRVLMLRAGQRQAGFEVAAEAASANEVAGLSASLGASALQTDLALLPIAAPSLTAPAEISGSPASAVRFQVAADRALTLAASGLPAGARFDAETGALEWLPSAEARGSYDVIFTAAGPGGSASATTRITIGSGSPALIRREHSRDPAASAVANPAAPVILTVSRDNRRQAVAFREGAADPAALPNPDFQGQPAAAGDLLSVWVTGIGCDSNGSAAMPTARFGDQYAVTKSLTPQSDAAGVCLVTVQVPAGIPSGQTPVIVEVSGPQGTLSSNTASVAIEN